MLPKEKAKERDRRILDDLERFRVLNRDQLIKLHFKGVSQQVVICNRVMKRLTRQGYVSVNKEIQPFDYYINPPSIQKKSIKILHYKAITDLYIDLCKIEKPKIFEVEYRPGGTERIVEPDALMYFQNRLFFVEVQRSAHSQQEIYKKYENYLRYFNSGLWKQEPWQKPGSEVFPNIWFYCKRLYAFPNHPIKIIQTKTVDELLDYFKPKEGE